MLGASPNAAAYLELHKRFQGYVLPMKGKVPDAKMSKRQRGTTAWKNDQESFYQRPPTQDEVSEWAAEGCGISVVTGPRSGIVALDIDCPELFLPLLDLPGLKTQILSTPIAISPSGGYHLLFRHGSAVNNRKVRCPVFNRQDSPCYVGNQELASFRGEGSLIVLPPGPGREWLPGRSITEVEPVDVPPGLVDLLERFTEGGEKRLPIEQGTDRHRSNRAHPCSIEQCSIGTERQTALLEDDSFALGFVKDKDSPLIPALVKHLAGHGLCVPCPYHPPDNNPSANFRYHNKKGSGGWYFMDHHHNTGDAACSIPVSQLCADLETGYIERCANGGRDHQHRVYTLRKMKPEAFFWVALAAADLGLVDLPPSRFPLKLDGFTPDGERFMRFIDRWDRARRCAGNNDPIPFGRPWLISIVFALPNPGSDKDESKPPEWLTAYNELDNALYRAQRQGILEKVAPGVGSIAALYCVCTNGGKQ